MKGVGIVLIVIGAILLVMEGISWTTEETLVDIGPLEVSQEREQRIPFSPIAGGIALAAGVVLLIAGRKA